jgi:hypothetical protein
VVDLAELVSPVILYPILRADLVACLRALGDLEGQTRTWANDVGLGDPMLDFDFVVHTIFDDLHLEESPDKAIGTVLRDEAEVLAISRVVDALNDFWQARGMSESLSNSDLRSEEWAVVVGSSQLAFELLNSPEDASDRPL